MKRGKEDSKYLPRKFVLREADDTLKYYIKEVCSFLCKTAHTFAIMFSIIPKSFFVISDKGAKSNSKDI